MIDGVISTNRYVNVVINSYDHRHIKYQVLIESMAKKFGRLLFQRRRSIQCVQQMTPPTQWRLMLNKIFSCRLFFSSVDDESTMKRGELEIVLLPLLFPL